MEQTELGAEKIKTSEPKAERTLETHGNDAKKTRLTNNKIAVQTISGKACADIY